MIARVTLEIALRKEFDYLIPPELAGRIEVGSRVKVPFGPRQVMGVVTGLPEASPHTNLRSIVKVIGAQSPVTPKVLALARWIAEYYCCPTEIALKSVLPEAVRREKQGWRERLFVRALPVTGEPPKLTQRQAEVWKVITEWHELPLTEILRVADTTAETIRRLEDKGLVAIHSQVSERDPYAHEHILPTQPLTLNPEQSRALRAILEAMDRPQRAAGVSPAETDTPGALALRARSNSPQSDADPLFGLPAGCRQHAPANVLLASRRQKRTRRARSNDLPSLMRIPRSVCRQDAGSTL